MGKKGKKSQAGKPKKLSPKDVGKRLEALVKKLEEELKGADLFAPLPRTEDCPICCIPLPRIVNKFTFKSCCGQTICLGCENENSTFVRKKNKASDAQMCPFCRAPVPFPDELLLQLEERGMKGSGEAYAYLGRIYLYGDYQVAIDELKAFDYLIRGAELGSSEACGRIASCYDEGTFVRYNEKRAALLETVAAVRGCVVSRNNIGVAEYNSENYELGIRHWKIAAEAGNQIPLDALKRVYNADGKLPGLEFIDKDDLDEICRKCHEAQEMRKSPEREKHFHEEDMWKC